MSSVNDTSPSDVYTPVTSTRCYRHIYYTRIVYTHTAIIHSVATIIIIVIIDLYSAVTLDGEALAEGNAREKSQKTAEMSLA